METKQQQMSKGRLREWKRVCFLAFWGFQVRERSDAEWGLARFCRESHCLVADGPTGRLFCDTSRRVFYYSLVD